MSVQILFKNFGSCEITLANCREILASSFLPWKGVFNSKKKHSLEDIFFVRVTPKIHIPDHDSLFFKPGCLQWVFPSFPKEPPSAQKKIDERKNLATFGWPLRHLFFSSLATGFSFGVWVCLVPPPCGHQLPKLLRNQGTITEDRVNCNK